MGARRSWVVATAMAHTVQVQHATHSGRVKITVDGEPVFEQSGPTALWDTGFDHEFTIDDLPCRLRISFSSGRPAYELLINGRPM